jgi:hypothetical protein
MQCELSAQVSRGSQVIFSLPLPPCWSDQVTRVDASTVPGIGDPLGEPASWIAWTLGKGEAKQSLAARLVRLAPQREGILLRTVHGGAAHDVLLLRRKDELRPLEIEGRWTAIAVQPKGQAVDEILLFSQSSGEAGFLWASQIAWDPTGESLTFPVNVDPPAFLVSLGQYTNYPAAEAVLQKACLPNAVVAPTDPYQGLEPKRYFVGAVSGDRGRASAALVAAESCTGDPQRGRMLPLRFRSAPLARLPLGPGNETAEFGVGRYDGSGWPLVISGAEAQRLLPKVEVSWPVGSPVGHPAADVDLPSGDPLKPLRGSGGWSFGTDQGSSLVALTTVRLTLDQRALLVSQEAGFEHRRRRHDLVVLGSAGMRVGWSAIDPPGPSWSNVVVRAKDERSDEIVLISSFESTQAGEVDRLDISRLVWDSKKKDLLSAPLGCGNDVYLAVSRFFPSLEQAIAAKREPCAGAPAEDEGSQQLVLPAPPRSGLRGFVLAQVSTEQRLARQAVADATRCWPDARASLVSWCPNRKR